MVKDKDLFSVEDVATQTQPVIKRGDDDVSSVDLLVEMANDLKELKAALIGK